MTRLIPVDGKATVTHTSEHTAHQTLKQMGNCWKRVHQNSTTEEWKTIASLYLCCDIQMLGSEKKNIDEWLIFHGTPYSSDVATMVISNRFHEHDIEFPVLQWPRHSAAQNLVKHILGVVEQEILSCQNNMNSLKIPYSTFIFATKI